MRLNHLMLRIFHTRITKLGRKMLRTELTEEWRAYGTCGSVTDPVTSTYDT
jgi:hypothetical protein